MINLTPLEALLITHLVMDWISQSHWEAMNKAEKWLPLLCHCFIYTLGFVPAFFLYSLNWAWLIFIFLSHIVLDRRGFEVWLLKLKGVKKENVTESRWLVLSTVVDQVLHFAVLAIVVIFS